MYWYYVSVWFNKQYLGEFNTQESHKKEIEKQIDEKFGIGQWTKYTLS
jgi:hypothetical protein